MNETLMNNPMLEKLKTTSPIAYAAIIKNLNKVVVQEAKEVTKVVYNSPLNEVVGI